MKQVVGLLEARRLLRFLALLMMAVLVVSMAGLNDADAKRKKNRRHHPRPVPSFNVIQCSIQGLNCDGTSGNDFLIDQPNAANNIRGDGGIDGYLEFSGSSSRADTLLDNSTTSSDYYLIANRNVNIVAGDALFVIDSGGPSDTLDLSPTGYTDPNCPALRVAANPDGIQNDLRLNCPGTDNVIVFDYFTTDSIEFFKFADDTFTIPKSSIASAPTQAQQQASGSDDERVHSSGVVSEAESNSSSVISKQQSGEAT